ncbi:hypothetical protein COLO4_17541 [Corchorus olitorius]|uniref:Uncharacterized protein n=1 Tax=Corchorus olitorius TaxID=93759 RepID=A0A1R3JCD2_9ROSI|nr:hypothetical protein COLO4_17541 [Corchorus olitorius]
MNPYDEKRLRDEVIYLHYLWHQGPPQNPDPNPRKRPRPLSQFPTYNSQRVAASGSCPPPEPDNGADWSALVHPQPPSPSGWPEPNSKTDHHRTQLVSVEDKASELRGYYEENHEKDAEPNKGTVNEQELGSSQITGAEWPCIEPQNATTSTDMGWPIFQLSAAPAVSAEEKIRFNMMQLQQNVFEACKQFFSTNAGSDIDEDEGDDDDEDEGDDDDEEDEGGCKDSKEFNFFSRLFAENNELRSYYETNFRGGEFCCLVCCGIGKKVWRTFKDCVGLLQHSTAISKTKRKRAHRAFGLVICDIIGWDIVCLPSIVQKSEPLSCSVEDLSEFPLDGRAWGNKDESGAAMDRRDSESSSKEDVDPNHNSNVNSENSMNGEASKGNDLENRTSNTSANQEKAVDSLNSPLENNTQPKSDDIQAESSSVPEPKEDAHNLKEEPSSNPETI